MTLLALRAAEEEGEGDAGEAAPILAARDANSGSPLWQLGAAVLGAAGLAAAGEAEQPAEPEPPLRPLEEALLQRSQQQLPSPGGREPAEAQRQRWGTWGAPWGAESASPGAFGGAAGGRASPFDMGRGPALLAGLPQGLAEGMEDEAEEAYTMPLGFSLKRSQSSVLSMGSQRVEPGSAGRASVSSGGSAFGGGRRLSLPHQQQLQLAQEAAAPQPVQLWAAPAAARSPGRSRHAFACGGEAGMPPVEPGELPMELQPSLGHNMGRSISLNMQPPAGGFREGLVEEEEEEEGEEEGAGAQTSPPPPGLFSQRGRSLPAAAAAPVAAMAGAAAGRSPARGRPAFLQAEQQELLVASPSRGRAATPLPAAEAAAGAARSPSPAAAFRRGLRPLEVRGSAVLVCGHSCMMGCMC